MQDYFAFGGCFRSEVEFPDLSSCPPSEVPDWEITISTAEPTELGELQGVREFEPGWALRLHRLRAGWRLEYGASGSYEILDEGHRIVWHPGSDRREELVRAVILGPLMALALHESGTLCLHGSAVAVGQRGVGFLAPKGYGKSTLAAVLAAAGGRLMSDDLVAVTPSADPHILPGVHSVRMCSDVAELLADAFPGAQVHEGWKKTLTDLPRQRLGWERLPLDAIYLISPVAEPPGGRPVGRMLVGRGEAALSLARNTKITDDLVGYLEAGTMLRWIAEIVSRVPVYQLDIQWDLERLPEIAAQILSWHSGANVPETDAAG
ncbi:hypothetical protein BH20GEM1_BH20GEM1_09050 [soil metagenome]